MTKSTSFRERHGVLGDFFEVPLEASKDCLVASGL